MAQILIDNITSMNCTVKLTGLDTSWAGGDRTAIYYVFYADGSPTGISRQVTISNAPSEGAYAMISGLKQETSYMLTCVVYDSNGKLISSINSDVFTTKKDTSTTFDGFSAEQTQIGEATVCVKLYGTNLKGSTYSVYVDGALKASGTVDSSIVENGIFVDTDGFGEFEISLALKIGATNVSVEPQTVTVKDMSEDYIEGFNAFTSSAGNFKSGSLLIWGGAVITSENGFSIHLYNDDTNEEIEITYFSDGIDSDEVTVLTYYNFLTEPQNLFGDVNLRLECTRGDYSYVGRYSAYFETPLNMDISNLSVSRGYKKLIFSWDAPERQLSYTYTIACDTDNTTNYIYYSRERNLTYNADADFGTVYTYSIEAKTYVDSNTIYGDALIWTGVSAPAPPVVYLSEINGYITVNYGLESESGVSTFMFMLYDTSNKLIETKTINVDDSSNSSGEFTFNTCCSEGEYTVSAITYIIFDGETVPCITSDGENTVKTTITVAPHENIRPDNFNWTYEKNAGEQFYLTAEEWNGFTERINDFRLFKNLPKYSFDTAFTDDIFTADMYNQARAAIMEIPGYGTFIPSAETGHVITADMLNDIVSELNAVQ